MAKNIVYYFHEKLPSSKYEQWFNDYETSINTDKIRNKKRVS